MTAIHAIKAYTVDGAITEDTDFSDYLGAPGEVLRLDLSGVARINSCGVREWLNFVRAVEASGGRVILERCSSAIVGQLNLIYNFTGKHGEVCSVLAPYACDDCGHEEDRLIELEAGADVEALTGPSDCPSCNAQMEFADLPDYYLQFFVLG
ncbi:MAG: hypothetical protein RMA76_30790 [Deltaproteobacteria bacterium]